MLFVTRRRNEKLILEVEGRRVEILIRRIEDLHGRELRDGGVLLGIDVPREVTVGSREAASQSKRGETVRNR